MRHLVFGYEKLLWRLLGKCQLLELLESIVVCFSLFSVCCYFLVFCCSFLVNSPGYLNKDPQSAPSVFCIVLGFSECRGRVLTKWYQSHKHPGEDTNYDSERMGGEIGNE